MLHHVPDISLAIRELRRVLRPGGTLVAVTKGDGHMAQMGAVFDQAVGDLSGREFHLDRSAERFTLEGGEGAAGGRVFVG